MGFLNLIIYEIIFTLGHKIEGAKAKEGRGIQSSLQGNCRCPRRPH
jgi:hypothetical protein